MSELKICRICLRTEAKGYDFCRFQLKYFYEEVIAQNVNEIDGLPHWFCFECATMLHKFHKFKEKCYMGQKVLKELLWNGPITYQAIYKIDRTSNQLQSPLEPIVITDRVKKYTIEYAGFIHSDIKLENNEKVVHFNNEVLNTDEKKVLRFNNEVLNTDEKKVLRFNNEVLNTDKKLENNENELHFNNEDLITDDSILFSNETVIKLDLEDSLHESTDFEDDLKVENTNVDLSSKVQIEYNLNEPDCPATVIADGENRIVELKSEDTKTCKSKGVELATSDNDFNTKLFSSDDWKKVVLTEDEAIKEFRARSEDPKFLAAAFKCGDCFKGFSKKEMLLRHMKSRHTKELGPFECRFCHMRFKWQCLLQKHTQQHFTKYECLRCNIVFHLDTSALLHEEYHSGMTKKCKHCNEEFRHITTYYTHLRTHRSEHVCYLCGSSFVSAVGLHQHKRLKHDETLDIDDDDDNEGDTYCGRCEIRFETTKAYEEHLFHSAMHTVIIKKEEENDVTSNKKILGKRLQAKITQELGKRTSDTEPMVPKKRRRRMKMKRKPAIPSTCYQCGEHFTTQTACMKHHLAEHPGTSFYAPTERYICELCGSSLAPGSVAAHQNMHTREIIYACDTCGREFFSNVALKRHLVTHTGEKPYGCPLCDKRFTQSNSMKLHYRTYHLKQPYPKRKTPYSRNRRVKKEDQPKKSLVAADEIRFIGGEDSDSLLEPDETSEAVLEDHPTEPEVPPATETVTVENLNLEEQEEAIHYLTLS